MSEGRYGNLKDANEAVRKFIASRIEEDIHIAAGAISINVEVEFASFLNENGLEISKAQEVSFLQKAFVIRKVHEFIRKWEDHGVNPPAAFHFSEADVLVTWRHGQFEELTGLISSNIQTLEIFGWLSGKKNRSFLLPCACYLKSLGCDPIYVTDGSGDEGIDCIGMLSKGPFRSSIIFVQAKSQERMSGSELLIEFGKFNGLPRTDRYKQYLNALGHQKSTDGSSFGYKVLVNGDFDYSAQTGARNIGALIRSRKQIALQLSEHYDLATLKSIETKVCIPENGNLQLNLAGFL